MDREAFFFPLLARPDLEGFKRQRPRLMWRLSCRELVTKRMIVPRVFHGAKGWMAVGGFIGIVDRI